MKTISHMALVRQQENQNQTLGQGCIFADDFTVLLEFCILELPWKNNERRVSRIPSGVYDVVKRHSPKYQEHLHILNVPGRDWILMHHGNFYSDILGCILPGTDHLDINGDGLKDVTSSKATMKKIMALVPNEFKLQIIDEL